MGIKLVLVHGFRPQVNEQLRSKGHESRYQPGPAHHRRGRSRQRAGGGRPAALRDRGGVLAGPAEHADGQRHRPRGFGQLPDRAAGGHRRGRRLHAQRRRAQGRAAAIRRAIDIGAMVLLSPFGFSPTGEAFNLTMEDVATSTAIALQADKLLFVTEVAGIREDPDRLRRGRSTPSSRWPTPSGCWRRCPKPNEPTDTGVLPAALREGMPRRRRTLAHPAVRGRRRAADGGVHPRRHRHDGRRREAREPARGDRPTTSAACCI